MRCGGIAQLGERLPCKQEVSGSIPLTSIMSGDDGERVTPVPIPNTEVKSFSADGTWGATPWESRTSPGLNESTFLLACFACRKDKLPAHSIVWAHPKHLGSSMRETIGCSFPKRFRSLGNAKKAEQKAEFIQIDLKMHLEN